MALDWQGYLKQIVDLGSQTYEDRTAKIVLLAGAVALVLLLVWKITK